MKKPNTLLLLLTMIVSASNSQSTSSNVSGSVKTGGIKMITVDGKYQVWTKKVGNGEIKVLLLHGGPGFTHEYFACLEDFVPQAGIEFYYYDQLGSAYSDQPTDTTLWRIDRFREEVEQVRRSLGLDNFFLDIHGVLCWGWNMPSSTNGT